MNYCKAKYEAQKLTFAFQQCLFGIGASAAFFTTAAAKVEGYGNLLTVGLAYGMGIARECSRGAAFSAKAAGLTLGLRAVAIISASATSGGHLSPCYSEL